MTYVEQLFRTSSTMSVHALFWSATREFAVLQQTCVVDPEVNFGGDEGGESAGVGDMVGVGAEKG